MNVLDLKPHTENNFLDRGLRASALISQRNAKCLYVASVAV